MCRFCVPCNITRVAFCNHRHCLSVCLCVCESLSFSFSLAFHSPVASIEFACFRYTEREREEEARRICPLLEFQYQAVLMPYSPFFFSLSLSSGPWQVLNPLLQLMNQCTHKPSNTPVLHRTYKEQTCNFILL